MSFSFLFNIKVSRPHFFFNFNHPLSKSLKSSGVASPCLQEGGRERGGGEDREERGEERGRGQRPGRRWYLVRMQELSLVVRPPSSASRDPAGAEVPSGRLKSGEAYAHQGSATVAIATTRPPSHPIFNRQKSRLLYTQQCVAHTQGPCADRCHPLGKDSLHTENSKYAVAKGFHWRWGRVGVGYGWRWSMQSNTYVTTDD